MRLRNPIIVCLLFLLGAIILAGADSFILSHRVETFGFEESTACGAGEHVTLTVGGSADTGRSMLVYLCSRDAEHHDSSRRIFENVRPGEDEVQFTEKFFVEPKADWALKCDYGEKAFCHNAGVVEVSSGEAAKRYEFELGTDEFAIVLEEDATDHWLSTALLMAALGLLVGGLAYGWRNRERMPRIKFKTRDGFVAFIISLVLGVLFSNVPLAKIGYEGLYIPQPIMSLANFGMFLGLFGTAIFYVWLRSEKGLEPPKARYEGGKAECDEALKRDGACAREGAKCLKMHPMIFAPVAGFVLAIVATISTLTIDDFTMSTDDLANQFTGQRLALAHFAMMAGISEELLYRGVMQPSIGCNRERGFYPILGLIVAAMLFTLVHVPQSMGHLITLIPVGLVGLTSGYVRLSSRSIFPSMTMHLTYNTSLLIPTFFV